MTRHHHSIPDNQTDFEMLLIGGGIMSATLASLFHELNPTARISIFERLAAGAEESSRAMNNAGTGHSAFCELNYTPQDDDGNIDIRKAIGIAESFEVSRQFRAYLVQQGHLPHPKEFIRAIPHYSLVFGEKDCSFLQRRYEAMRKNLLFRDMEYSEDPACIQDRMPLIMKDRLGNERMAATRMHLGTDVNFGALTRNIFTYLTQSPHVAVHFSHEVTTMRQDDNHIWHVTVSDIRAKQTHTYTTRFLFIGAGGGALQLAQKAGMSEIIGYGGFPVSGQWLVCKNPEIVAQHHAKVYGKAKHGTPPMSVPHLDTRMIDGKKALLFGPYAGFTTKFLQHGSFLDLFSSLRIHNIRSMLGAGAHNLQLTKYLIQQVTQSREARLAALREYMPSARSEDWELHEAGYRVQIIKPDSRQGGKLEFGTEVVVSTDHTCATLLGASPGASTAVDIMIRIIETCFPEYAITSSTSLGDTPLGYQTIGAGGDLSTRQTTLGEKTLATLIPSYGKKLHEDEKLLAAIRQRTGSVLGGEEEK